MQRFLSVPHTNRLFAFHFKTEGNPFSWQKRSPNGMVPFLPNTPLVISSEFLAQLATQNKSSEHMEAFSDCRRFIRFIRFAFPLFATLPWAKGEITLCQKVFTFSWLVSFPVDGILAVKHRIVLKRMAKYWLYGLEKKCQDILSTAPKVIHHVDEPHLRPGMQSLAASGFLLDLLAPVRLQRTDFSCDIAGGCFLFLRENLDLIFLGTVGNGSRELQRM